MKAYLMTTGTLFALLTLAHIVRVLLESSALAADPFFVFVTILSATLCAWAFRLLWSGRRRSG